MSSAERFVRHHKRQTDRAISEAYSRLASDASATFRELLRCTRDRGTRILDAPVVNGRHQGIEALANLSRFRNAHVRRVSNWCGTSASWHRAVASLAQHLTCPYVIPVFLGASWHAAEGDYAERKREWFVAHGRGASFRSLDLPIAMSRKMEHIFLGSCDHFSIEHAMRRAELVALGATDELVDAVVATRAVMDLRHGAFWRTVWRFLIANAQAIDVAQVGPLLDFLQAIRHERVAVETRDGIVLRDPPQPSFSMKGRTVRSVLRLMQEWHRGLGVTTGGFTWSPSPLRPMFLEEPSQDSSAPPMVWQLMELTNSEQLRIEGSALHHCVASYAGRCWRGASRIWSLRVRRGAKIRHVLTIEVDLNKRAIVQARGWCNRSAAGKSRRLLKEWAARERLRLLI